MIYNKLLFNFSESRDKNFYTHTMADPELPDNVLERSADSVSTRALRDLRGIGIYLVFSIEHGSVFRLRHFT
jgi:hypothetical protein